MIPIREEQFGWIYQANEILSKKELLIEIKGDRIISDYDVILSLFSSNLTLLHAIPETKKILYGYLRTLERLAMIAKYLFYELTRLEKAIVIKVEDKYYYLMDDNTILKEEDRRMLEEAYRNVMEAFRRIARAYIYTLLAGIETEGRREIEQQPYYPYQYYPYPQAQQQQYEIKR